MYLQFVIACFIATFFSIHGGPVDNKVYEMIKFSAGDVNLKCPYVRTTKLLEPQPAFFSKCVSFVRAKLLTMLDTTNVEDGLCLLYYNNFEHLCYVSNNYTEVSKRFLSNAQIDQIPTAYQNNVSQVCTVLKNTDNIVEDLKPGIEAVRKHLEDSRKCERICTDLDLNIKPVCALSAFMMNATKNIYKEIQSAVSPDSKTDKIKSKPSLIDHNADIKDDSKNKNAEITNKQPNVGGVSQTALLVEKNPPTVVEGQSPNTQKLPAQNPITPITSVGDKENNALKHRWDRFYSKSKTEEELAGEKLIDEHDKQSATTTAKSSLGDASIKQQGNNLKEENIAEQGLVQTSPSAVIPTNIPPSKVETPVIAPTIPGPKPGPQISNNPLTGIKTNIGDAQQPGATNVLPSEETIDSKMGPKEEKVADANNNQMGVDKTPLGGGNLDVPISDEFVNVDDTNKDQKNGIATKEDGGIEAAGESPQEAKDQFEDSDMEGLGNDQDDYSNMNDLPPKSSEVKTKPQEISKPLETNEDGPSFAANYQNQSIDDSDSYFFSYFMMVCIMFICGYVAYHNKQKILALVVEGRKGRRPSRTRRPNSANYRKLDSNLEEAVTSSCNKNATQVIY